MVHVNKDPKKLLSRKPTPVDWSWIFRCFVKNDPEAVSGLREFNGIVLAMRAVREAWIPHPILI